MIKICYIIGQLSRHGAEKQLYELAKVINKKKFLPLIISLSQNGYWAEEIRKLDIQVIEIPRRKNREIARLFKLIKLLTEIKPEIVHTYLIPGNFYGRIAALLTRVPVIIASERNLPEIGKDKTRFRMFIDKVLALFTDGIICNSYMSSETLIRKYSFDHKKMFTVHNGIDKAEFMKGDNSNSVSEEERIVIGTVGRLWPQKNHFLFLDMAKTILDRTGSKGITFLIIGEGPLKGELGEYTKQLGLEDRVVFAGERFDIPELLHTMDIFVMTSSYEGLSNTIMEAMAAGLPVVATDVGGNRELIIEGETGFLCPSNADALAEKVHGLIKNQEKAKQMGERGTIRMLNEFGIEEMVKATEDIYLQLLEGRIGF